MNPNNGNRERIMKECSGNTTSARKYFWQLLLSKVKRSSDINGVVEEISELTE